MHKKKLSQSTTVNLRLGIIVLCFLISMISRFINFNWCILFLFSLYFLLMILDNIFFSIKYFPVVISVGMITIGTFIIEHSPLFLNELKVKSSYSGALPLLVGYYLTFLIVLELRDKRYSSGKANQQFMPLRYNAFMTFMLDTLGIMLFIIMLLMILRLTIISKPCFISHVDRFTFKKIYIQNYPFWKKCDQYLFYLIPILVINWKRDRKILTSMTITCFFLYYIWIGARFTEYRNFLFIWLLPFMKIINSETIKIAREWVQKYIWFIFSVLILLFLSYKFVAQGKAIESFFQRIAQQGQLWWSIYTQQKGKPPHLNEISDELSAFSKIETKTPYYGVYKIMYLCAPWDVVTAKIATGSAYTESQAASIYYYFGEFFGPFVLIFFAIIIGVWLSFLVKSYVRYVNEARILESILSARLLILFLGFYSAGRLENVFGLKSILSVLVLVMCENFFSLKTKYMKNRGRYITNVK